MMYSAGYPYNGNVFQTGHTTSPSCTSTQMYNQCSAYYPRYMSPSTPSSTTVPYQPTVSRDYPPPLSHPNDPTRGYYPALYREDNSTYYRTTTEQGVPQTQDYIPSQANQQCRFAANSTYEAYSENCDEGIFLLIVCLDCFIVFSLDVV